MSDEQDQAESIDEDVVDVDDLDDFEQAPEADFPPDRPLGVDDIGVDEIPDDVRTRAAREEPEWSEESEMSEAPDDSTDVAAEEAAMHEIPE